MKDFISLKVIAPVPTDFFHCMHCEQFFQQAGIGEQVHRAQVEQYPEGLMRDTALLAEWLMVLAERFEDRIRIRVIDPQSMEGFALSLRHWVRSYPAFILAGRKVYSGWDQGALERILHQFIAGRQRYKPSG